MATTKPELVDVDPSTLLIGDNIRRDAHADTLVSSLKSNGMLHPIRARRTDDGLEVIDGQRRTLAAIDAGMKAVPVLVVAATDSARVFEQYVSNEHREALTDGDRVLTIKRLSLFNLAAGTIAKRTGMTKTAVERALTVSDEAVELAPHGTLEDLAELASIEGQPEYVEAAKRLADGDLNFFRSIIRKSRARVAVGAETARLRAAYPDLTLLETPPAYGDKRHLDLTGYEAPRLEHEDGTSVPSYSGYNVEPDLDSAIEHFGVALAVVVAAAPGYGDALTKLKLYVDAKQLKAAGLRRVKPASAPEKSVEEKQAEQDARDRSKAWAATGGDRKEWLARLLNEKQPPSGWERFVLERVFDGISEMSYDETKQQAVRQMLALDHLDMDDDSDVAPLELLEAEIRKRPDRAPFALLAYAFAALEEDTCRFHNGQWIDHKPFATHGHLAEDTPAYLDQLEKWGYDAKAERDITTGVAA